MISKLNIWHRERENGLIKNGVIHRGSQVKKGWRRAEVVVPRKRLLGRQARARECRSGAGRPGAAGTGWREASHLAAGGSRDAPTRTYPGVSVTHMLLINPPTYPYGGVWYYRLVPFHPAHFRLIRTIVTICY